MDNKILSIRELGFLKETLFLAKKGLGRTNPNPMVGCVIVKNNKIIGKGYHKKYGSSHAEIEAFNNATESTKGATLYVNLEPCCHFGKTPPCTKAIIKSGIKKVICCTLDPNKKVAGKGVEELKKAGIEVRYGFLQDKASELNEVFFTFHQKQRPFVVLKFASSLDGKIATANGDSKWITNEMARKYARQLRGHYQAILVGANTVIKDNPNLGAGDKKLKDPLRVILDAKLKIPFERKIFRDKNVLILTTNRCNKIKKEKFLQKGIEVCQLSGVKISAKSILRILKDKEVNSVFVEGGSEALGTFVDEKLVDRVFVFHAPIIVGGGANSISAIGGSGVKFIKDALQFEKPKIILFGDNILISTKLN